MAPVSIRRSRTISVASRRLTGSFRLFFHPGAPGPKIKHVHFFSTRPNGHGYSRTSSRLQYGAYGIIPDGAGPAIRDHPASHPVMCEPKGWLKHRSIFQFFGIKFNFSRIKSATKFCSVKTSSGKVVEQSISYEITEHRTKSVSFHLKYRLKLAYPVVASTCMLINK